MSKLIIGGDICPTESNYDLFEKADIDSLIGKDLKDTIQSADYCFLNLEVALTDDGKPIKKAGPNLKSPTVCINGLKAINPYIYGLANNHIMDFGYKGLQSTIDELSKARIEYTGVGKSLADADRGYSTHIGETKVGFYCCAEHEFSIATDDTPGANPFDPLVSLDTIQELSLECDYCVVIYHGGKEYYRYPSPRLQKICRKIAEKGADLIVCQHSHCVGCKEIWGNSTIVYGQGNFLFDGGNDEFWNTSLLIEVVFEGKPKINFLPLRKNKNCTVLDVLNGTKTIDDFNLRSEQILSKDFIKIEYSKFASRLGNRSIYSVLNRKNYLERALNKISGHTRMENYKCNNNLALLNYMECEAWNELCVTAMRDILGKEK